LIRHSGGQPHIQKCLHVFQSLTHGNRRAIRQTSVERDFRIFLPCLIERIAQLFALHLAIHQKIQDIGFGVIQRVDGNRPGFVVQHPARQVFDFIDRAGKAPIYVDHIFDQDLQRSETFAHGILEILCKPNHVRDLVIKFIQCFLCKIYFIAQLYLLVFLIKQSTFLILVLVDTL